jgi:hypothetical protein
MFCWIFLFTYLFLFTPSQFEREAEKGFEFGWRGVCMSREVGRHQPASGSPGMEKSQHREGERERDGFAVKERESQRRKKARLKGI